MSTHAPTTAVLLVNLGTPDAPTASAVRRYLAEFLHDHRVVAMSRWLWCPILHGIILPLRARQVAPHRRGGGGVGRAQVHHQHGGAAGAGGLGGIAEGLTHAELSLFAALKLSSPG